MDKPPFCPNPECTLHHASEVQKCSSTPFSYFGSYTTLVAGTLKRFRCSACGRTFSERSFLLDFYTKKSLSYQEFQRAFSSGENLSAMARNQGCSIASVQNRLDRLSRNCILMHVHCLEDIKLQEDLSADGFETYDASQYHPNNINLLVGTDSQFLYGFTHTTLRRKGRMTEKQKERRTEIEQEYTVPQGSFKRSFAELVEAIIPLWDQGKLPILVFKTDEHKTYPLSLEEVEELKVAIANGTFTHERYSSLILRTITNPLFAVNYWDRELRKDIAAYHRESVCFVRNVANGLARLSCYMAYHNYQKDFRIKWGVERTPVHAVVAGIEEDRVDQDLESLYTERRFYRHHNVSSMWRKIWNREYKTPLKKKPEYLPLFVSKESHILR